jgi:hypothetical protein
MKQVMQPSKRDNPLLRIHPRYMRSVHLEGDFADPASSQGYVLTPVAETAFARIFEGFDVNSTRRAFRIAGDYGSGKSAFGLALARLASGSVKTVPKNLHAFAPQNRMFPYLATGDNEPLGATVFRALGIKTSPETRPTTAEVLLKIEGAKKIAKSKGYKGILLVLDELGKNLEFAAQNPEADDVFLLQRLAEEAARSKDSPLVIVLMLHQGIAAYTSALDMASRREWDKVAGRFEEIVYAQPLEQVTTLIAATLDVNLDILPRHLAEVANRAMATALRMGIYGSDIPESFATNGCKVFPLHPTVLPVLLRTIRKFGQNERSLFGFLSASEPMGLQHHLHSSGVSMQPYRISHLFEYVRQNLLPALSSGGTQLYWGGIDGMLATTKFDNPEQEAVFKTVALLTLLDFPDIPATEAMVELALADETNHKSITKALETLKARHVFYERGASRGFCIWPYTSVNLDEALKNGETATRMNGDGIELLCQELGAEQIVPRGHYFRSGTLRYGEIVFLPAAALDKLLASPPRLDGKGSDLNLRVLLPANPAQFREVEQRLEQNHGDLKEGLFIAVAQPPAKSVAALSDLLAWKWVRDNTPALAADRYGREEVMRQVAAAKRCFSERLRGLDRLELPIAQPMNWFSRSGVNRLNSGRQLLSFLGEQCDRIYHRAPHVLNELINRRLPSSAAVAARTKLAEVMAKFPGKPLLGLDESKRPPEMALYLSILKAGGFHVETEGVWNFRLPSPKQDVCHLLPALNEITRLLRDRDIDALVPLPEIFNGLGQTPFGIREGLQPFILALYLATHHQQVALYEDGTYLAEVGGDVFLRLMKEPQYFHLQFCQIDGLRADVFTKLLQLLQISPRDASKNDLLDLVRPLVVFISREVPEYSRKTNNLSKISVAVRQALLDAREPVKFVFTLLPQACGLKPIGTEGLKNPEDLAGRLRAALHEIRTAYPQLIIRLQKAICAAFDVDSEMPVARNLISSRASQLSVVVTEPVLKAFILRLADTTLGDRGWIESVANLLARKSCERWGDIDETEFHHQVETAAGRFKRTEMALLGTTKKLNGHVCRIALTKSDGSEVGDLINWDGLDENRIQPVEGEIQAILKRHGRHGLAAATRAIWSQLNMVEKKKQE